jgi:hypothetical protein
MNFERGQDPKKAMGVGLSANSIKIDGIAEFKMQANGKEYVEIEDEERIVATLRLLQENLYNSDPNDIKFTRNMWGVNMWGKRKFKKEHLRINFGGSDTEEKVIEYKDKYYIIPTFPKLWSRWQDVTYHRHLFKTGQFIKA